MVSGLSVGVGRGVFVGEGVGVGEGVVEGESVVILRSVAVGTLVGFWTQPARNGRIRIMARNRQIFSWMGDNQSIFLFYLPNSPVRGECHAKKTVIPV